MKSQTDSSLHPPPPKPGLGSYFKSQPQIQLWCLHPNLEQCPHFRPDGEMQPWGEVKKKTNMSTCNRYLDSAQHVDFCIAGSRVTFPRVTLRIGCFYRPWRQSSYNLQAGWDEETPTAACVIMGWILLHSPLTFGGRLIFITNSDFLERRRTLGNVLHSWGNSTEEKQRQASFGHVWLGATLVISTSACPQTTAWGTTGTSSRLFYSIRVEEGGRSFVDRWYLYMCLSQLTYMKRTLKLWVGEFYYLDYKHITLITQWRRKSIKQLNRELRMGKQASQEDKFSLVLTFSQLKICVHVPDVVPDMPIVIVSLLKNSLFTGISKNEPFTQVKPSKGAGPEL